MRWPGVNENEGGEGQGLNVERGALMCGRQGAGSWGKRSSREAPQKKPAGILLSLLSSPQGGNPALGLGLLPCRPPHSPQTAENTGGPGPLPVPGMGFITALSLAMPG